MTFRLNLGLNYLWKVFGLYLGLSLNQTRLNLLRRQTSLYTTNLQIKYFLSFEHNNMFVSSQLY